MRRGTKTNPGIWFRTKAIPHMRGLEIHLMAKESWDTVLLIALPRILPIPRAMSAGLSSFALGFLDSADVLPFPVVLISRASH